jgi:hypothetical protein
LEGRGRWISEFKASLIYRVSYRTARSYRTAQRNPVLKNLKKKERKKERKNFHNFHVHWCFACVRVSDPLELESQIVLSCHMCAEN